MALITDELSRDSNTRVRLHSAYSKWKEQRDKFGIGLVVPSRESLNEKFALHLLEFHSNCESCELSYTDDKCRFNPWRITPSAPSARPVSVSGRKVGDSDNLSWIKAPVEVAAAASFTSFSRATLCNLTPVKKRKMESIKISKNKGEPQPSEKTGSHEPYCLPELQSTEQTGCNPHLQAGCIPCLPELQSAQQSECEPHYLPEPQMAKHGGFKPHRLQGREENYLQDDYRKDKAENKLGMHQTREHNVTLLIKKEDMEICSSKGGKLQRTFADLSTGDGTDSTKNNAGEVDFIEDNKPEEGCLNDDHIKEVVLQRCSSEGETPKETPADPSMGVVEDITDFTKHNDGDEWIEDDRAEEGLVYDVYIKEEVLDEEYLVSYQGTGCHDGRDGTMNMQTMAESSSKQEAESKYIGDVRDSNKTKEIVNYSQRILRTYCQQRQIDLCNLTKGIAPSQLDIFLQTFYAEIRRGNGEMYAKRSLITLRYGLHRYFMENCHIDICRDDEFRESNDIFKAVLYKMKLEGKDKVQRMNTITPEDMDKIRNSSAVDTTTPKGLQNRVFLDLILHLGIRGRETLRQMQKDDFGVKKDSGNRRYIQVLQDKIKRNSQYGSMYETGMSDCPVKFFLEYVSRLNDKCHALWQRPKATRPIIPSDPWYDNAPLGINALGNKMSAISTEAQCSSIYTNHCLCTAASKLDRAGFGAQYFSCLSISGKRVSQVALS